MWIFIDIAVILTTFILYRLGKRNIVSLLKILGKVGVIYISLILIMLIFRIGDVITTVLYIGCTLFFMIILAIGYFYIKKSKNLDDIEKEKFVAAIAIIISFMIYGILDKLIEILKN